MSKIAPPIVRWWKSALWWTVTLVTLVALDDMVFGPVFWALSQIGPLFATLVAFGVSLGAQTWLIRAGLRPERGRVVRFLIARLMLGHKRPQIAEREASLQRKVVSTVSAVLLAFIVGGILPILFLQRRGVASIQYLRRLGWLTSVVYALEFSLIHGGYGLGALFRWLV